MNQSRDSFAIRLHKGVMHQRRDKTRRDLLRCDVHQNVGSGVAVENSPRNNLLMLIDQTYCDVLPKISGSLRIPRHVSGDDFLVTLIGEDQRIPPASQTTVVLTH